MSALGCIGTPTTPVTLTAHELSTGVQSMTFFDRLNDADITFNGHIRGCFEETFHGMTVGDKLREMLVNEDSENAFVFTEKEKKEVSLNIILKCTRLCKVTYNIANICMCSGPQPCCDSCHEC